MTRNDNPTASGKIRRAPREERRGSRGQQVQAAVRQSLNAYR
jgi:hypothetical protein